MNICFNGKIIPEENARLSILDKAVWYDFGIYETIKVLQGVLFYPELHIKRLFESALHINLNLDFSEKDILEWIVDYIAKEKLENHLIKICIYGDTLENKKANTYIFALGLTFHPDRFYKQGISVKTFVGERFMPQAKSMNLLQGFYFYRITKDQGAFEGIMIDKEGSANDGIGSNLFIIQNGMVITPPAEKVLRGVTRRLAIDLIKKNDFPFIEKLISKKELFAADEVFLTSTVGNIIPVIKIDDKLVGRGAVGPITRQLIHEFRKLQKNYLGCHEYL